MDRFGVACPSALGVVRPGEQGVFVRRPRADRLGGKIDGRFEAAAGRWGLIPLFSPDGADLFTHEAHAETAAAERNFLQPWKRGHRCVVLADTVFHSGGDGKAVIGVTRYDGQPLALAGLWNGWRSPTGQCVESFALLTLGTPECRNAVILPDAWVDDWLHCAVEETASFLRPFADDQLVQRIPAPC